MIRHDARGLPASLDAPQAHAGAAPAAGGTDRDADPDGVRVRPAPTPRRGELRAQSARVFFTAFIPFFGGAALLATQLPPQAGGGPTMALALAGLTALAGLLRVLGRRSPVPQTPAMSALLSLVVLLVGAQALGLLGDGPGGGMSAPGLGLFGLFVCILGTTAGGRAAAVVAALCALVLLGVAAYPAWAYGSAVAPLPLAQLVTQLMGVAAGLACGVIVARVVNRLRTAGAERERRFASLLALAADAYWEIDDGYRLVAISATRGMRAPSLDGATGQVPWELPAFACDPDVLDALQADLDARVPFRDVVVRWTGRRGQRLFRASGEPRFDRRGRFRGYWGVVRDVTEETAARVELAATEMRYQELFSRIPTPLVLHRAGRVIDANPAAVALFGWEDDPRHGAGLDLLGVFEGGDSRERARRRLDALLERPVGTALPVAEYQLDGGPRGRLTVRATGVKVEMAGGPAFLAIFVDDTDRRAAEEAVRRSEALLAHLVETTPDLITLTDLETGRYAMVNPSFERMFGWRAAEVVGRTSVELGVWPSPAEREAFARRIREQGAVTEYPQRFRRRDGRMVSLRMAAAPFEMDHRQYLVINARDVSTSEREQLEREAILAGASVGIALTRQYRFVLANRHLETLLGTGAGGLIGKSTRSVFAGEDEYQRVAAMTVEHLSRNEPFDFEMRAQRVDGTTFIARVRGQPIDPAQPTEAGTVWIVEDVTERREFERALARARDDAEAASRAKSAFLANTSHELRTPLNGMLGLAHLARDAALPEATRTRYLDQIVESAQALAAIISDILDLSKIEAGKLALESVPFDLDELLATLVRTYGALAGPRGLALRLETPAGALGHVRGDPLRVRQIVSNFLGNAIKFTEHGEVVLLVRREAREGADGVGPVHLEVRDTGPGIDAAALPRLFAPFTQADESTTRRFGGTGLGLSICRELAHRMGGDVGVASEPGAGSRFWARLPLAPVGATATVPAPAARGPASGPASGPAAPVDASAPLAGTRVLLVEDNAVNMMVAAAMLERWGVQVVQAVDGPAAIAAVEAAAAGGRGGEGGFDLVLMDVQMPQMSGHEATRLLRAAGHRLPIVALTAAALVSERDAALAAGMDDFLTKPIDAERLRATVARWAGARAAVA